MNLCFWIELNIWKAISVNNISIYFEYIPSRPYLSGSRQIEHMSCHAMRSSTSRGPFYARSFMRDVGRRAQMKCSYILFILSKFRSENPLRFFPRRIRICHRHDGLCILCIGFSIQDIRLLATNAYPLTTFSHSTSPLPIFNRSSSPAVPST